MEEEKKIQEGAASLADTEITQEVIDQVKEKVADEVRKEAGIGEEQSEAFRQMCEEACMPVEYLDKDFKLGPNELDIRTLSKRNQNQMFFRTLVLHGVYLRNISKSLIDVTNLLLVLADKLGVQDIIHATDEVLDKIREENETLKALIPDDKKSN